MSTTQIKGSQIQDGTIKSEDIDDSLEKDFTKARVSVDDSTSGFLSSKISAGNNVSISVTGASGSNQVLTISATGGVGGGNSFFSSTVDGSLTTTGSFAIKGQESISSPSDKGQGVFFYVSGTLGLTDASSKVSLFGGDVLMSGALSVARGASIMGNVLVSEDSAVLGDLNVLSDANIDGKLSVMTGADMTGSVKFVNGMSGSLTNLIDGTSYLIAGTNITIVSASNGSVTISSSGGSSSAGPQGFQGEAGIQGFQGSTGAQGAQGFQGELGLQGSQGFQGVQGDVGFQGSQGSTGQQGDGGQQGSQGFQGSNGFQGDVGTQGNQGFQGIMGAQGSQGSVGVQGSQGSSGVQGSQGASGTGVLTLIETKTLSATGSVTFSSLNGDSDKTYFLEGEVTVSSGALIEIHPNGNSGTVMLGSYITNTSGITTPAGGSLTKLSMPPGSSVSSGERLRFTTEILADSRGSTFAPLFQTHCINDATAGGGALRQAVISNAFTSRSAITSLRVFSTGGNMTGRISLFKRTT